MSDAIGYGVPLVLLVFAWGWTLGSLFPTNDDHEER